MIWTVMIQREPSLAVCSDFNSLHIPYVQEVKMTWVRGLEKAECSGDSRV